MKIEKLLMVAFASLSLVGFLSAAEETKKVWNISDYGAQEGDFLQTAAIQRAIDACYQAGGGEVRVPAGFYRTGGIRLRSRVTLHLMSGAVLEGSRDPEDYEVWRNDTLEPIPPMTEADKKKTRSAVPQSRWCNGLIRAYGAHDVAIIGEPYSLINGQNCFDAQGEEGYRGPHAISMWYCTNVVLRGYTIKDSANWAHAIFNSSNITARTLTVLGGHDGFDVRTCDDVTVEKCVFKTGDDAIAGFDNIGVTIRDCVLDTCCSALRFGGTDVLVENCTAEPGAWGFRGSMPMELRRQSINDGAKCRRLMHTDFLYYCDYRAVIRRPPGNILIRNCTFTNPDSVFELNFGRHIWCCNRSLSSITYENCTFDGVDRPLYIHGDLVEPLEIMLRNCTVVARKGFEDKAAITARNYKAIRLENTDWKGFTRPRIEARTKGEISIKGGTPLEIVPVEQEKKTVVGAVNWDCSLPSGTWFGRYATTSLSPAKYRHATPYYADVKGSAKIDYHWRDVKEYEREMQYAIDAGIDYFAYCWYGETKGKNLPPLTKSAGACCDGTVCELVYARQLHMKSALRNKLKLCAILVPVHPYLDEELDALAKATKESSYQRIEGRPLVYLFSGTQGDIVARLRAAFRRQRANDPFIVLQRNLPNKAAAIAEGVQALSAYNDGKNGIDTFAQQNAHTLANNARRAATGMPVVPAFTLGWDPSPRVDNPVPWTSYPATNYMQVASEPELLKGAQEMADWIKANRASCPTGHVLAFAWNEFEEGAWICPTWRADGQPDTSRLQTFRKVVDLWRKELD